MPTNTRSKYVIEIVRRADGKVIADFSGRAMGRMLRVRRNRAGQCIWSIPLDELESFCRKMNMEVDSLLTINSNEVKIRRGDKYLFGGQINYTNPSISNNQALMEVRASGYLDLFDDRDSGPLQEWTTQDAGQIARDLVTYTQGLSNGNFGIAFGVYETSTSVPYSAEYKNIKDALIDLSQTLNGFDFEFTPDKKLNIYKQQGTVRDDLIISFPGNIRQISAPKDGTLMVNSITARGALVGNQQKTAFASDASSQTSYLLRQKILDYPDVTDQNMLQSLVNEALRVYKEPYLQLTEITIDGNKDPIIGSYWLGDRFRPRVSNNYSSFKSLKDVYVRIDEIQIDVDDNDSEQVKLTVSKV